MRIGAVSASPFLLVLRRTRLSATENTLWTLPWDQHWILAVDPLIYWPEQAKSILSPLPTLRCSCGCAVTSVKNPAPGSSHEPKKHALKHNSKSSSKSKKDSAPSTRDPHIQSLTRLINGCTITRSAGTNHGCGDSTSILLTVHLQTICSS